MSQTPTEPASPRVLARARARGDLPYASELPLALALLALVVIGAESLVDALKSLMRAAFAGRLPLDAARPVLSSLLVLLAGVTLAALLGVVVQRAPTLGSASGDDGAPRGRPRPSQLLAAVKALLMAASLCALVYDSAAGWRASSVLDASGLLAATAQVLPAVLARAAWVCVLLGIVELVVQQLLRLRRLRMTRQQVQDEQRELAGDPRLLSERRARASELPPRLSPQLAAASLAQLSQATLLITGRSNVVAIEYKQEVGVPRVWLSAEGPHALELLQRAYSLQLPIVSDEPLALDLQRAPLRAAIPSSLHARVAQLLLANGAAHA